MATNGGGKNRKNKAARFKLRVGEVFPAVHVEVREVFNSDGTSRVIHSVDAESPTLGKDLEHLFRLNVAKARRDNERIVGVADFVPGKR